MRKTTLSVVTACVGVVVLAPIVTPAAAAPVRTATVKCTYGGVSYVVNAPAKSYKVTYVWKDSSVPARTVATKASTAASAFAVTTPATTGYVVPIVVTATFSDVKAATLATAKVTCSGLGG